MNFHQGYGADAFNAPYSSYDPIRGLNNTTTYRGNFHVAKSFGGGNYSSQSATTDPSQLPKKKSGDETFQREIGYDKVQLYCCRKRSGSRK